MESINGFIWSKKTIQSDQFCWACHGIEPTLFCSACLRSFHTSPKCSESKKLTAEQMTLWKCPVCIMIEKDELQTTENKIDVIFLNKLLKFVADLLINDEYLQPIFLNIDYSNLNPNVVNAIDLTRIEQKTENSEYRCCDAFLSDVMWIVHNTKARFQRNSLAIKATKWLLDFTREEIFTIRLCHECYFNANRFKDKWFTMTCKKLHLLIWAQQETYPYWPAKLMRVNANNTVDIRSFGCTPTGARSVVRMKDCYMYSENSPGIDVGKFEDRLKIAQKEVNIYIRNILNEYGSFSYAQPNVPLNGKMLDRHLFDMVPNAWKKIGKSTIPLSIPKPISARRQSMPACVSKPFSGISSISGSGRIIKRRDTLCNKNEQTQDNNQTVNYRQLMEFNKLKRKNESVAREPIPKFTIKLKDLKYTYSSSSKKKRTFGVIGKSKKISPINQNDCLEPKPKIKAKVENPNHSFNLENLHKNDSKMDENQVTQTIGMIETQNNSITNESFELLSTDQIVIEDSCKVVMMESPVEQHLSEYQRNDEIDHSKQDENPDQKHSINTISSLNIFQPENSIYSGTVQLDHFYTLNLADQNELIEKDTVKQIIKIDTDDDKQKPFDYTELAGLCSFVGDLIDTNTQKLSECARSSIEAALFEFSNAAQNGSQALQNQLDMQQIQYDQLISELRTHNHELKRKIDNLNMKYDILKHKNTMVLEENVKLNSTISQMQSSNDERDKNVKENCTTMSATVTKLQAENEQLKEDLTKVRGENVKLTAAQNEITIKLNNLTLENQSCVNQINDLKSMCDFVRSETDIRVHEAKKKQWCASCGLQGRRYYCSRRCEARYYQRGNR